MQGAAAAQNGVSVVQPNVGRLHDWYNRHPGMIRDPNVRWACGGCCPVHPRLGLMLLRHSFQTTSTSSSPGTHRCMGYGRVRGAAAPTHPPINRLSHPSPPTCVYAGAH